MAAVFISYRREDSFDWASKLNDALGMRFGRDLIFRDFDDIKLGDDFIDTIKNEIMNCTVFLVVIGPLWLTNAAGQRRIEAPDDVLRMEITDAIGSNSTIIPILVGDAKMPAENELPATIKSISRLNALELRSDQWYQDIYKLIERLQELILPEREQWSIHEVRSEVYRMQLRFFDAYSKDISAALEIAQQTHGYLDRAMMLYPKDANLQMTRGYCHKNEAMALKVLGRYEESDTSLNVADHVFNEILDERPNDAGAWNGKGSVEAIRGNYEKALQYIDRALEIMPEYQEAIEDRERILSYMDR